MLLQVSGGGSVKNLLTTTRTLTMEAYVDMKLNSTLKVGSFDVAWKVRRTPRERVLAASERSPRVERIARAR